MGKSMARFYFDNAVNFSNNVDLCSVFSINNGKILFLKVKPRFKVSDVT